MSNLKKDTKSKFPSTILNGVDKQSPKSKKGVKRTKANSIEEEDMPKSDGVGKQQKISSGVESGSTCARSTRQKVLETMTHQIDSRKESTVAMLNNLSEVLNIIEAEMAVSVENKQKLELLTEAILKCFDQVIAAQKQNLKSLWGIHNELKQECEQMNELHSAETDKLADEVDRDINNLEQKLVMETKRSGWEKLRYTLFKAMQNDFAE